MSQHTKILVVEDERIIAMDIAANLRDCGYDVVGTAASTAEALQVIKQTAPDLVIMDIVLDGESDGIDAADKIWREHSIPVIYLTAYTTNSMLDRAKLTNPFGYLVKPFKTEELHASIQMALHRVKSEAVQPETGGLLQTLKTLQTAEGNSASTAQANRIGALSPRERQVLELFLRGYGTGTIASRLTVSAQTVRNHLKNACRKFEVHSQIELRELFAVEQSPSAQN